MTKLLVHIFSNELSNPIFCSKQAPNPTPNPEEKVGRRSVFQKMTSSFLGLFVGSEQESPEPQFQISSPYNFKHHAHVQIDPHSSTGFSVSSSIFFTSHIFINVDGTEQLLGKFPHTHTPHTPTL
ncbi:hypothetical protein EON65_25680 [archaeon]|nr:MAG: hypothetical protein EON65_25680 [archaeon]